MPTLNLSPPSVPQRLREMLKDYPEHVERLQEVLTPFAVPKTRFMPFDEATWALEGRLESFINEAREELAIAEASGDTTTLERAKVKLDLMFDARSRNFGGLHDLEELWNYFQINKEAFE